MAVRRRLIRGLAEQLVVKSKTIKAPIPVERIARRQGIRIVAQPYEGNISGFYYRDKQQTVIGVNSEHHLHRRRFTIAHELGHYFLHKGLLETVHVDREFQLKLRSDAASQGTDPDEVEANVFAAELLMPAGFIESDLQKMSGLDLHDESLLRGLAQAYRVSLQALLIRLTNLGYIDL